MARRKTKIKDKWRDKKWITVLAPTSFNSFPISYIPITSEEHAIGRVIEVTLFDIVKGDPSQHQFKLAFQINKIEDGTAKTIFKRYEYAKEYLRSLVRRGSTKINFICDCKTKDGSVFSIKIIILTQKQINSSRMHTLRLIAKDVLDKTIPDMTLDQFVQATAFGKINSDIMAAAKKIIRIRHIGLEKVKLIRTAEAEITLLKA